MRPQNEHNCRSHHQVIVEHVDPNAGPQWKMQPSTMPWRIPSRSHEPMVYQQWFLKFELAHWSAFYLLKPLDFAKAHVCAVCALFFSGSRASCRNGTELSVSVWTPFIRSFFLGNGKFKLIVFKRIKVWDLEDQGMGPTGSQKLLLMLQKSHSQPPEMYQTL